MKALTRHVAVRTAGLTAQTRSWLERQLCDYPEIDLEHLEGWSFRLLHADVLVLDFEHEAGRQAGEMIKSFQGYKAPIQVTFSESEERMRLWDGVHPLTGRRTGCASEPLFPRRLQDALRRAGCYEVVIDGLVLDRRVAAGGGAKPAVQGGIRWTG